MSGGAGFLPSTVAPENWWLGDYFNFWERPIFRCCVGFREGIAGWLPFHLAYPPGFRMMMIMMMMMMMMVVMMGAQNHSLGYIGCDFSTVEILEILN